MPWTSKDLGDGRIAHVDKFKDGYRVFGVESWTGDDGYRYARVVWAQDGAPAGSMFKGGRETLQDAKRLCEMESAGQPLIPYEGKTSTRENPTLASAQRVIAAGPREWPPEQLALFARIYDFGHVNYHQQDQKHVDALFDLGLVMYQPPNEYHSEGIVEITEAGNEFADNIESVYLGYPGR